MHWIQRLLYAPLHVHLVVTRQCNLSCAYCNEHDPKAEPVPLPTVQRRLDRLRALGAYTLAMTGGEPLLHPQIVELVRYAKARFLVVVLLSNGFLLTRDVIRSLNEAGLDGLQVSLDGVEPNGNTRKVLALLRDTLLLLREHARFRVTTNTVLGAAPAGETVEVLRFSRELGFPATLGLIHDGGGRLALDEARKQAYPTVRRQLRAPIVILDGYARHLVATGERPFRCRGGSRFLYVDESGDVHWCSQQRAAFGKPLREYSVADLRAQFLTIKGCSVQCTLGCVRRASLLDGWRRQAA